MYCVQSCKTGNAFIQQIYAEGVPCAGTSYKVVNMTKGPPCAMQGLNLQH